MGRWRFGLFSTIVIVIPLSFLLLFLISLYFPSPLAFGWRRWRRQRHEGEAEMKGEENRKWMASLFGYLSLLRLMIEMIVIVFKVNGNGCERSQVQRRWAFIHAVLVLSSSLCWLIYSHIQDCVLERAQLNFAWNSTQSCRVAASALRWMRACGKEKKAHDEGMKLDCKFPVPLTIT